MAKERSFIDTRLVSVLRCLSVADVEEWWAPGQAACPRAPTRPEHGQNKGEGVQTSLLTPSSEGQHELACYLVPCVIVDCQGDHLAVIAGLHVAENGAYFDL